MPGRDIIGALLPDVMLAVGYLLVGLGLATVHVALALVWLGAVPFVIGAIVTADQYRKERKRQ